MPTRMRLNGGIGRRAAVATPRLKKCQLHIVRTTRNCALPLIMRA